MKKSLKITAIFMVIAMIVSIMSVSNAYSANVGLESSSTLQAGNTVTVKYKLVSFSDLPTHGSYTGGIDAMMFKIDYDSTVFEPLEEDDIKCTNPWKINDFSDNQVTLLTKQSVQVNQASDVLTITFKVKNGVNTNSTNIKLTDILLCGGRFTNGKLVSDPDYEDFGVEIGEYSVPDAMVTINKAGNTTPTPTPTPTPTGKPTGTPTPTPTGKPTGTPTPTPTKSPSGSSNSGSSSSGSSTSGSSTSGSSNSGTVSGKLPQTGESALMITASIALVSTMAGIGYFKFKRIDK